ncbi:MAG: DUF6766 family protein [Cytophaga sp.]|uniref:DUF6766 family protein n=1 Tax=Cytophaga sp. TaxID=29535 RepID=UPI003F7DFA50
MKKIFTENGLSIAFILLFLISITGQFFAGHKEYNTERAEAGRTSVNYSEYLSSGHFIEATFENWESEFLQMALFVVLTIFLRQKGSSESKAFDKKEAVDREPSRLHRHVPWPVKAGGWILSIYKHSLTIALSLLFLISFALHFYGSLKDENEQRIEKHKPTETAAQYISSSKFWFESFQNWQSEFLSVFAIISLSVFLRQQGSSQSKPVDAPNSETGE